MLRRKRQSAGYSQEEVAKALGRHRSYLAKIETGERRLDVVEFIELAKVLDFDPAAEIHALTKQFK